MTTDSRPASRAYARGLRLRLGLLAILVVPCWWSAFGGTVELLRSSETVLHDE